MIYSPIPRLVTSMAVPTVISMLITVVYNTADTYFVSQINKSASAAVGAIYPVMAIIQAVGYGLAMGGGSLSSLMLGQKKNESAHRYATTAFFCAVLFGVPVAAAGLFPLGGFLRLLGCSDTMLPYAQPYARIILLAAPLSCSMFVLTNLMRAQGKATVAMWGLGASGVMNLLLDPLFIFKFNWGTGGAALATVLSQAVCFAIFLIVFLTGRSILLLRPKYIAKELAVYRQIILTGLPTICRQSLGSLSAALLNIQAVVYGDAAVSAVTIANKAYVLVRNMVLGIGQGFMPVAGYNYGAGEKKRTWQAFVFAGKIGSALCLVSAAVIAAFAGPIMRWFSSDAQVVAIGTQTLLFCCAVMPFMAVSTYVNQLYQCLGFKAPATFLASCRQGVFFVPAVFILPALFGLVGVELSQPAADLLTFFVCVPFMAAFYRKRIADGG